MADPFDFLDFTQDEAKEILEKLDTEKKRTGRVCICGHPVGRHDLEDPTDIVCSANKNSCPCKSLRPVIEVDDARVFMRKTAGAGAAHSLGQGLISAVTRGQEITWLVEQKCDACGAEGKLSPVATTEAGFIVDEPSRFNALLCNSCREKH